MSPTRNSFGEVTWSKCSREFLSQLDMPCLEDKPKGKINRNVNHNVLGNVPGNFWNTDMQCQFLLKDDEAFAKTQSGSKMCSETLECSSKNRFGVFRAGPVLEGTKCGKGNLHCISGECEEVDIEDIAYLPEERPEWSEWKEGSCKYNCIKGNIKLNKIKLRIRCFVRRIDWLLYSSASMSSWKMQRTETKSCSL